MEQNGSTTTEQANQKVSETDRLFPLGEAMLPPEETAKAETEGSPEQGKEVSSTPKPTELGYLDLQDSGDKKVKVKIDGVETEILLKDVVKGYQTEQYLTRKGQALAEERKKIQGVIPPTHSKDDYLDPLMLEKMESLEGEVAAMKEREQATISELAPLRYERSLRGIDSEMKAEGLTDFREKLPEIEKILLAMPPDRAEVYDTVDGFKSLYKSIKLQEFTKKQAGTTINSDMRIKPKVVPIESSSSPSGGVASTNAERDNAMALAKKSGNWVPFMQKYG